MADWLSDGRRSDRYRPAKLPDTWKQDASNTLRRIRTGNEA